METRTMNDVLVCKNCACYECANNYKYYSNSECYQCMYCDDNQEFCEECNESEVG